MYGLHVHWQEIAAIITASEIIMSPCSYGILNLIDVLFDDEMGCCNTLVYVYKYTTE